MSSECNSETQQALSREIKALRGRCLEACHIIDNSSEPAVTPDNVSEKALCYVEGVRTEIQNSNTPIQVDKNLLTSQFLNEIKEKTVQVEELTAFAKGCLNDIDAEINMFKKQIKIAQDAKSCPVSKRQQIQPEHLKKAKEMFNAMKTELHSLLQSLLPDRSDQMKNILAQLMEAHMKELSNGYIPITMDNFSLIEILKERNIVSANPYNETEVKFAYH